MINQLNELINITKNFHKTISKTNKIIMCVNIVNIITLIVLIWIIYRGGLNV